MTHTCDCSSLLNLQFFLPPTMVNPMSFNLHTSKFLHMFRFVFPPPPPPKPKGKKNKLHQKGAKREVDTAVFTKVYQTYVICCAQFIYVQMHHQTFYSPRRNIQPLKSLQVSLSKCTKSRTVAEPHNILTLLILEPNHFILYPNWTG